MKLVPSCSVKIDPDEITFHDFDPYADSSVTLNVLRQKLAELERQAAEPSSHGIGLDRWLTTLAKKRSLVESTITSFSSPENFTTSMSASPRRDKRIAKKLRRKAARLVLRARRHIIRRRFEAAHRDERNMMRDAKSLTSSRDDNRLLLPCWAARDQ